MTDSAFSDLHRTAQAQLNQGLKSYALFSA